MAIANNRGYVERGLFDPFGGQVLYPLNANSYPNLTPLILIGG